jgi:hypothetical protein
MKNIWSVIFNRAVVDGNTNSISLFDGVEEITVNFSKPEDISMPQKNIPINFTVISLWSDEDTSKRRKFEYLMEILDPQNKKISEFSNISIFEAGKKRLRTIIQINGMAVTLEGEYTIVVKYKMKSDKFIVASKIPLDIKFVLNTSVVNTKTNNK